MSLVCPCPVIKLSLDAARDRCCSEIRLAARARVQPYSPLDYDWRCRARHCAAAVSAGLRSQRRAARLCTEACPPQLRSGLALLHHHAHAVEQGRGAGTRLLQLPAGASLRTIQSETALVDSRCVV